MGPTAGARVWPVRSRPDRRHPARTKPFICDRPRRRRAARPHPSVAIVGDICLRAGGFRRRPVALYCSQPAAEAERSVATLVYHRRQLGGVRPVSHRKRRRRRLHPAESDPRTAARTPASAAVSRSHSVVDCCVFDDARTDGLLASTASPGAVAAARCRVTSRRHDVTVYPVSVGRVSAHVLRIRLCRCRPSRLRLAEFYL